MDDRPVGFFDSGVGGLTILRAVRRLLPGEHLVYLADSAHFPYGAIHPADLRTLTTQLAGFLLLHDVKLIVVACNTATVHALSHLRATFPNVPFVGVVPVVKTLAQRSRTGVIALLSTPATAQSTYLADLIATFAPGHTVINVACAGLADLVEQGDRRDPALHTLLARYLEPVQGSSADVLGLGCTHYPFLTRQIRLILGPRVRVYDSALPVARRVHAVLAERGTLAANPAPRYRFFTTGDPDRLGSVATRLLRFPVRDVEQVTIYRTATEQGGLPAVPPVAATTGPAWG